MKNITIIMGIEPGIELWGKQVVLESIKEVLEIPGVYNAAEILEHNDIKRYLDKGQKGKRGSQLDARKIIDLISTEMGPLETISKSSLKRFYKVILIKDDIYDSYDIANNFVIGLGQIDRGAVISIYQFMKSPELPDSLKKECIKSIVLHELGHVFGGSHCKNQCTMRMSGGIEDCVRIS